jgi:hypothetical protein
MQTVQNSLSHLLQQELVQVTEQIPWCILRVATGSRGEWPTGRAPEGPTRAARASGA